jgi:hypothetical protein
VTRGEERKLRCGESHRREKDERRGCETIPINSSLHTNVGKHSQTKSYTRKHNHEHIVKYYSNISQHHS